MSPTGEKKYRRLALTIKLVQQQPCKYQHYNHGLSEMVQVKIKQVTNVAPKAPIAYHILKPIDCARLWAREEFKRTNVQDAVRCRGVAR